MWEHGPENQSENRSSAMQGKPDRKKAEASQASEQRSGKNSPGRRQQRSKARTLKKIFVSTHKRPSKTTHKTHGHPHPATPSQEERVAFWGGHLGGGGAKPPHPPNDPPPKRKKTPTPPPKHQKTNAKFWHEFRNNAMELRSRGKASTVVSNRLEMSILPFQMVKLGVSLMVNISKLTLRKRTKLTAKWLLLATRFVSKYHLDRSILRRNIAKLRLQTCRPKIDLLNYKKGPIKHIWGEFSLSVESKEPILRAKFVFFLL